MLSVVSRLAAVTVRDGALGDVLAEAPPLGSWPGVEEAEVPGLLPPSGGGVAPGVPQPASTTAARTLATADARRAGEWSAMERPLVDVLTPRMPSGPPVGPSSSCTGAPLRRIADQRVRRKGV